MSGKVSEHLWALRSFWLANAPVPSQDISETILYQKKLGREDLNGAQMEPIHFELSRHVLKKVSKTIKSENKSDALWLNQQFIKPSVDFGCPITISSHSHEFPKIQSCWQDAVDKEPTIKEEGALILSATKKGIPITGVDIAKYKVNPTAVQSNVLSTTEEAATHTAESALSKVTNMSHDPAKTQIAKVKPLSRKSVRSQLAPAQTADLKFVKNADLKKDSESSPTPVGIPTDDSILISDATASPLSGGVKITPSSPRPVSPTSTLRSGTTSPASSDVRMMRAPPYASSTYNDESYDGSVSIAPSSNFQHRLAVGPPKFGLPMQETPISRDATSESSFQIQHDRHLRHSGSTALSGSTVTVTSQATITTGDSSTVVPFNFDNVEETIEDIKAFTDWKASAVGRNSPVDYHTFLSIMRFRPNRSNALVLRKHE